MTLVKWDDVSKLKLDLFHGWLCAFEVIWLKLNKFLSSENLVTDHMHFLLALFDDSDVSFGFFTEIYWSVIEYGQIYLV